MGPFSPFMGLLRLMIFFSIFRFHNSGLKGDFGQIHLVLDFGLIEPLGPWELATQTKIMRPTLYRRDFNSKLSPPRLVATPLHWLAAPL